MKLHIGDVVREDQIIKKLTHHIADIHMCKIDDVLITEMTDKNGYNVWVKDDYLQSFFIWFESKNGHNYYWYSHTQKGV